jgi:hypothetical protein
MFVSFPAFGNLLNLLQIMLIPDYVVLQAEQETRMQYAKNCVSGALCALHLPSRAVFLLPERWIISRATWWRNQLGYPALAVRWLEELFSLCQFFGCGRK